MKKVSQTDYIILVLSVLGFLYILFRAILIPGYHDEINSFFIYIQTGNFLPFKAPAEQNNHVLNSLFSYILFKSFGTSIITLRLANVLSFIIYLYYVWRIGKTFKSANLTIAWFITMVGSLYFISFFSLSRGYGLSMAFLTAAVYHLLAYFKDYKNKNILIGLFTSVLSLWAYLGVMVPVLLIGCMFICLAIYRLYACKISCNFLVLITGFLSLYVIPLAFAIKYSFFIKSQNALLGSDSGGFIQSVIFNMADEFTGNPGSIYGRLILILIIAATLLTGISAIKRKGVNQPSAMVQLLFWGTIAGTLALKLFLEVEYPKERMLIYFFLLIMVAFFITIDEIGVKYINYLSYLVAGLFAFQLVYTFNFAYAPCWKYDTLPRTLYQKIGNYAFETGTIPTVSTTEILEVEYGFQNFENKGKLNVAQCSDFPGYYADFIVSNDPTIINTISDYDTIMVDAHTKVSLLKRRNPVNWVELHSIKKTVSEGDNEFLSLAEKQDCIAFRNHPFCFEISFKAQSAKFPFRSVIVCDVWDGTNKSLRTNVIRLQNINSDARNEVHFHKKLLFENIPSEATSMVFYCLNSDKTMVKLTDIEIKLLKGITN